MPANPTFDDVAAAADILDGVDAELRKADYQTLVGAAGFADADQRKLAHAMVDRQMDGLVLIAPGIPRADVLRLAESTPTVVIGHHDTAAVHDTVVDADAEGTALLVDHLLYGAVVAGRPQSRVRNGESGGESAAAW